MKGLISTGFKMPKNNVMLSIGSFKEKNEFLPSAKKLVDMGFTLFGTAGTADFMSANDVKIQVSNNWFLCILLDAMVVLVMMSVS
jgi:hypothetical protein